MKAVQNATARDVAEAIDKLNAYTSRAANERRGGPVRGTAALLFSGAYHFFRHYVLRRQFLNGVPGLTWSMLFAVGSVVKHVKAHELAPVPDPAGATEVEAAPPAPQARVSR